MSDDEKNKPGDNRAAPESIAAFTHAVASHQDPAKQALINSWSGSDDGEWDPWKITIESGRRSQFAGILDFFVNLPSLQELITDASITDKWLWKEMERELLSGRFATRPEIERALRLHAGADRLITEGWLLKNESGQVDSITTWTEASYLLGTEGYFAYIQVYQQHIH